MQIPWHDPIRDQKELPVSQAPLPIRAGVVGRVGLLLLSCGTGAWRVRSSMNEIAEALGLVCAADIGLLSIEYTCSDGENTFAQTLTLTATGVNTAKLDQLERFVKRFPLDGVYMTADDLHTRLDEIAQAGGSYTPLQQGAAAALACGGFTFLLGGGPIEMLLAFLGAGVGQYVRAADAAAPDAVWLHRPVRCGSMSGLCRAVPAGIAALAHRPTASGGVYLRDAVHHSGLPVHHERHRHVQAGHALRT